MPPITLSKLAQYAERDRQHPKNYTYEGIENFNGVTEPRYFTNPWWGFLFTLLNCAIIILIMLCNSFYLILLLVLNIAILKSDTARVEYGQDFRGDVCGKFTLENRSYFYWPDPVSIGNIGVCLQSCPVESVRKSLLER